MVGAQACPKTVYEVSEGSEVYDIDSQGKAYFRRNDYCLYLGLPRMLCEVYHVDPLEKRAARKCLAFVPAAIRRRSTKSRKALESTMLTPMNKKRAAGKWLPLVPKSVSRRLTKSTISTLQ